MKVLEEVFKVVGSALRLSVPEEEPGFDRHLAELDWGGEPLFLLMAGLIAARDGLVRVLTLNRSDLAFEVAGHELSRIGRIGESRLPQSKSFLRHMAAYVTLCQGLTRDQAEEAVAAEKRALRYDSAGDPPEVYKALHESLPRAGMEVAPILPDVVGEAAILLALGDGDSGKARQSVVRAAAMAPERVTAALIRTAQDFGGEERKPLDWIEGIAASVDDLAALARIVDQLPENTLALREVAATLTAAVLEKLRAEGAAVLIATGPLGRVGFPEDKERTMIDIALLASAAVAALSPYLTEAAKAGAKKVGEATFEGAAKLYQTLKTRLTGPAEKKALEKLEAAPEKPDNQAALRVFLEERLSEDPDLRAEVARLVEEARPGISIQQTANITGDGNTNVQIAGSGNRVGNG